MLRETVAPPVPRRPTKPTRGSQRRRLAAEKQRGETECNRRRLPLDQGVSPQWWVRLAG